MNYKFYRNELNFVFKVDMNFIFVVIVIVNFFGLELGFIEFGMGFFRST